jgi:acyl-CoA thioesterase FadM
MREQGFFIVSGAHEIEYFNSAQRGDPIEIISWPYELGRARGAWIQEVRHAETGELLVRDYNVGVFVDADGRPTRPPAEFVERAVQGAK